MVLFIGIVLLVTVLDQVIKFFIETNIYRESITIIENIFSFTYLENYGAAWGIFSEESWFLTVITPILLLAIIYYLYKFKRGKYEMIICGLIVGGALGNYIDRLFRGYVVDYIDFKVWPVFNFADICIVIGCILFSINLLREGNCDGD